MCCFLALEPYRCLFRHRFFLRVYTQFPKVLKVLSFFIMSKLVEYKGTSFEVLEPEYSTYFSSVGGALPHHFKVGDRVTVIPQFETITDDDFTYHLLGARMLIDVYGGKSYTIADVLPERVESKSHSSSGDDTEVMYKLVGCGDRLFSADLFCEYYLNVVCNRRYASDDDLDVKLPDFESMSDMPSVSECSCGGEVSDNVNTNLSSEALASESFDACRHRERTRLELKLALLDAKEACDTRYRKYMDSLNSFPLDIEFVLGLYDAYRLAERRIADLEHIYHTLFPTPKASDCPSSCETE